MPSVSGGSVRRAIIGGVLMGAALVAASAALAQTSQPTDTPPQAAAPGGGAPLVHAMPVSGAAAQEMADLFESYCLKRFPDDAAVSTAAVADGLVALTEAEVKGILKDDPGRGWYKQTDFARYTITVESPPYHTCAVRRMSDVGIDDVKPYIADVNHWMDGHGAQMVKSGAVKQPAGPGIDSSMFPFIAMNPATQQPMAVFIVVLTNYHGHYAGPGVTSGPGVEVRYVYQDKQQ